MRGRSLTLQSFAESFSPGIVPCLFKLLQMTFILIMFCLGRCICIYDICITVRGAVLMQADCCTQ